MKNIMSVSDLIEEELGVEKSKITTYRNSLDESEIDKLRKAKDKICYNNGVLEKLTESTTDEKNFYEGEAEKVKQETEKLKVLDKQFLLEQTEEMKDLEETLYYARKIRIAVNNSSENYLDNIRELCQYSGMMLPLEMEGAQMLVKKKQSLEKIINETKDKVETLKQENEMLLQKLDKLTIDCNRNVISHGYHESENNSHCPCDCQNFIQESRGDQTNCRAICIEESVVPRLDLSFLDSDFDSEPLLSSASGQSSDSSEDSDSSLTGSAEKLENDNKKMNIFQRLFSFLK